MIKVGEKVLKEAKDFEMVIDLHAHLGLWSMFHMNNPWEDHIIQVMDLLGIDKICIASLAAVGADATLGNQITFQAMKRYPQRIIGLAVINPHWPKEAITELNTCIKKNGMRGIKLHPTMYGYPIDGPGFRPAFEYARDYGLPIITHTDYAEGRIGPPVGGSSLPFSKINVASPLRTMEVAVKFPNVNVVLVHSGHDQEGHQLALEAARGLSNVYLDFSGTEKDFGLIEEYVSVLGASRVVFSTDEPYLDPRSALGRVTFAEITDEEKAQVLGLNAVRLLRLGENKEANS